MDFFKYIKYTYLITTFIFFIVILTLNQFDKNFHQILNNFESEIIELYTDDIDNIYIIFTLLIIVLLKGFGIKDIFGFTNFFIILLSRLLHNNTHVQIFISIIISGFLHAIEKFIKYYCFSIELQTILSKPFDLILFIIKKILLKIPYLKNFDLSFLTTKYLFLLSDNTKKNKKYNIIYNFRNEFSKYTFINISFTYIISILWLTFSEWFNPFKELILYVHNWDLNYQNIFILICSEFIVFDNIIEIILMVNMFNDGAIMKTRLIMIIFNFGFSFFGYIIFFIPSIYWIKKYYYSEFYDNINDIEIDIEMN